MNSGYMILCQPFTVLGYVVNVKKRETETAIIESGGEYYTLPLDYSLLSSGLGCVRYTSKKGTKSLKIEFNFNSIPFEECRNTWWLKYCKMRDQALKIHIYV